MNNFKNNLFDPHESFEKKARQVFEFQRENNPVYNAFCKALGIQSPESVNEIPLLPIQAFKDTDVLVVSDQSPITHHQSLLQFQSSGTSGMQRSKHYIKDPDLYRQSVIRGMQHFYDLDEFVIWAYTPGYNENPNSSLVWMLNELISRDDSGYSRFLELNKPLNENQINKIRQSGKNLMLFGAAFGLLDLLELKKITFPKKSVIMETGGMKTHRREMSRENLHENLATGFGIEKQQIHSEYGMTELLSQAYSLGDEWFNTVPWMEVSIRNPENPMSEVPAGKEGLIGVTDLANLYSCSFVLTSDKGIQNKKGQFKVLGRWNPKDLRGCNFLIEED